MPLPSASRVAEKILSDDFLSRAAADGNRAFVGFGAILGFGQRDLLFDDAGGRATKANRPIRFLPKLLRTPIVLQIVADLR
jgi:hypothetical protein